MAETMTAAPALALPARTVRGTLRCTLPAGIEPHEAVTCPACRGDGLGEAYQTGDGEWEPGPCDGCEGCGYLALVPASEVAALRAAREADRAAHARTVAIAVAEQRRDMAVTDLLSAVAGEQVARRLDLHKGREALRRLDAAAEALRAALNELHVATTPPPPPGEEDDDDLPF